MHAYAEAMARKLHEMEEYWATFYDVHFGPPAPVGPSCMVVWCCDRVMTRRPDEVYVCFGCGGHRRFVQVNDL